MNQRKPPLLADLTKYNLPSELQHLKNCTRCKLRQQCNQVVPGSGNLQSQLLIVLEAPGVSEDYYGFPAVNKAHYFIEELEQRFNLTMQDYFVTNSIMCRPPDNRDPSVGEQNACHLNLSEIIARMSNLKFVLCVGRSALKQVEGGDSTLGLLEDREGQISYVNPWVSTHPEFPQPREFWSMAIYHPLSPMYKKSEIAKKIAETKYQQRLHQFYAAYQQILSTGSFEAPYEFWIPQSPKESFDAVNFLVNNTKTIFSNGEPAFYSVDFETSAIKTCAGQDILCLAIAYDDYKAVIFPVNQTVDLPKSKYYKVRGPERADFTMKWGIVPWFDAGFEQTLAQKLKPILASEYETKVGWKPYINAHHFAFEFNTSLRSWGYPIMPRMEQLFDPVNHPIADSMVAFRICNSSLRRMNLDTLSKLMVPLENKNPVDHLLTSTELSNTGYALFARKDTEESDYFVPQANMTRSELLFKRCGSDTTIQLKLAKRVAELLTSADSTVYKDYINQMSANAVGLDSFFGVAL